MILSNDISGSKYNNTFVLCIPCNVVILLIKIKKKK